MKPMVRSAALFAIRLFAIIAAAMMAAASGVLIATPGISRIAGIGGLVFTGQLVGVFFADWINKGRVRPQWAAIVRPGDTLVLGLAGEIPAETANEMIKHFREALPGVKPVLAIGVTSMAVQPPSKDGAA